MHLGKPILDKDMAGRSDSSHLARVYRACKQILYCADPVQMEKI
ncbi:hypothetical protein ES702_07199 [subsurface metagenome]